jgi:DNA-binding NarL/FixJ family response regulator
MIRVYIADDHAMIREGMRRVLDETPDIRVVGEGAEVEAILRDAAKGAWDVLVLDMSIGERSGLEVLAEMKQFRPDVRVLVMTMHAESSYGLRALAAGALGYITKGSASADVIEAIRAVGRGKQWMTPALRGLVATADEGATAAHEALSARELTVLTMLARGSSPSQIAEALGISASTVSTYFARIRDKLRLATQADLVQYAIRAGLV